MRLSVARCSSGKEVLINVILASGGIALMVPIEDARIFMRDLAVATATEEITRRQCAKCLKDCAECKCIENRKGA